MTRDEAVQKAIKLLRLSKSSNPHEAALAAKMAQDVLDRYEISQAMLEDGQEEDPDEEILDFGSRGAPLEVGKKERWWKTRLADLLAKANSCKIYRWSAKWHKRLEIIGRASDVEKVRYLYEYLKREVDRLTNRDGKGNGSNWRNEYRFGVVAAIGEKLQEGRQQLFQELRTEAGSAHALVKVDKALAKFKERSESVERWAERNKNFRRGPSYHLNTNVSAQMQGLKAGREIRIGGARGALGAGKKQLKSG